MRSALPKKLGLALLMVLTTSLPAGDRKPRIIDGWGKLLDPDGDCLVKADKTKLSIMVPATLHDLNPRSGKLNAPRILQEVQGDFTIQVRVTSDFEPGKKTTAPMSLPFISAGLVLWSDEKNYLRLERNLWWRQDLGKHVCYTPLIEYFKDGVYQKTNPGDTSEPFFKGRSTHFRIARRGDKISVAFSHDGKEWLGMKEIATNLPREISVGLLAINTSDRPFRVEFDEFSMVQR